MVVSDEDASVYFSPLATACDTDLDVNQSGRRAVKEGKVTWSRLDHDNVTGRVIMIDDNYIGVQTSKGEMCVTLGESEFLILADKDVNGIDSDDI